MTRLILGTAQLGSGYGITNNRRRIADDTVRAILRTAITRGIETFDTAVEYDDSQDRLGELLTRPTRARFITKFSLAPDGTAPSAEAMFTESMRRLRVDSLAGLLFHRIDDLRDARCAAAIEILREAQSARVVERIGASIYDRADLDLVLETFPDLSVLQIPANIVDRRLLDDTDVAALHTAGVEIHVRSAFLQGLLLADPETFDSRFAPLVPVVEQLRAFADDNGLRPVDIVLGFLAQHPNVDGVLVGATNVEELEANADAWVAASNVAFDPDEVLPIEVIDPRLWSN